MKKLIPLMVFLSFAGVLFAQNKPRLAILPFTGDGDGETIARLLAVQDGINSGFNLVSRNAAVDAAVKEQDVLGAGLTDSDAIASLGKKLNAAYVIAGHTHNLGESKLLSVALVKTDNAQQAAGDYREYKELSEVQSYLPEMARRLADASRLDTKDLPKLTALPLVIPEALNVQDAALLERILLTGIINSGKYAVFPRTAAVEKLMEKHKIQRMDLTSQKNIRTIGQAIRTKYVLAGAIAELSSSNLFIARILDVESGTFQAGGDREYRTIGDGFRLAADLSRQLTGANFNPAVLAYRRGVDYRGRKEWDRAIEEFTEAIRLNPSYGDAYYQRGYVYQVGKNNPRQGAADYNKAIELRANKSDAAWNNLGNIIRKEEDYDKAIQYFTNAVRLNPNFGLGYKNRGNIYYFNKKDFYTAAADYTRVIQLNPQDADAYYKRGHSYERLNNYDQAFQDYSRSIELAPDAGDGMKYNNRGLIYYQAGNYDAAIGDYTRAIQLNAGSEAYYRNRAAAYEKTGKRQEAEADRAAAEKLAASRK
ncbi:MAG: tetratricopeptide repeat protein [Treponema sp.]|jgi:tetratricopeptide (TPR) repeat protein|nr:tetratricopeptide repeat protein [Treponema sp.]